MSFTGTRRLAPGSRFEQAIPAFELSLVRLLCEQTILLRVNENECDALNVETGGVCRIRIAGVRHRQGNRHFVFSMT